MKRMYAEIRMDQPILYRVEVQGRLDERWVGRFDGMTVRIRNLEDIASITTLEGVVADQAALHAMLRSLYNLGFPLLSVSCLETNADGVLSESDARIR